MIKAKKILRMIRSKVKDTDEVRFSDYEIIDAVNECIRYINVDFALKQSDFLEKIERYSEDKINAEIAEYNKTVSASEQKPSVNFAIDGADLPEDFVTIVSVVRTRDGYHMSPVPASETIDRIGMCTHGGYKVFGNRIYCDAAEFDLMYRREIQGVSDVETGEIDIPAVFTDLVVKVSCMILQNNPETDVLMREISLLSSSLVPRRRYSNVKQRMPFLC